MTEYDLPMETKCDYCKGTGVFYILHPGTHGAIRETQACPECKGQRILVLEELELEERDSDE
jgi:DnaJ-class molecular chaperone